MGKLSLRIQPFFFKFSQKNLMVGGGTEKSPKILVLGQEVLENNYN